MESERGISTAAAVIIAIIVTGVVVGSGVYFATKSAPPALKKGKIVEVYHWWTSGSEKKAIDGLVDQYESEYPGAHVIQTPIPGGEEALKSVLKPMIAAGEAPDSFQTHGWYDIFPFYKAGYVEPITDIWEEEGLSDVIPDVIGDMVKFDDDYYAIPLCVSRVNLVWYNKPVLDANGIDPNTLTTWDKFFDSCETLVAAGITHPIALADRYRWTTRTQFTQTVATLGVDVFEDWINGKNPDITSAFRTFKRCLSYVNEDHAALTWDQAVARVIRGESAFNFMGDWSNGEFVDAGKEYGKDYGVIPMPGTGDVYSLCLDCFTRAKGTEHPTQSLNWARVAGSKAGQDAFSPAKGSIPARTDADTSKYGPYQRSSMHDFKTVSYIIPALPTGTPVTFRVKLGDIVSSFVTNRDVSAAASALKSAISEASADFVKTWSLD